MSHGVLDNGNDVGKVSHTWSTPKNRLMSIPTLPNAPADDPHMPASAAYSTPFNRRFIEPGDSWRFLLDTDGPVLKIAAYEHRPLSTVVITTQRNHDNLLIRSRRSHNSCGYRVLFLRHKPHKWHATRHDGDFEIKPKSTFLFKFIEIRAAKNTKLTFILF